MVLRSILLAAFAAALLCGPTDATPDKAPSEASSRAADAKKPKFEYTFRFTPERVMGKFGLRLAAIGLTVVFSSLVLISLFIAALPRVIPVLDEWLPPKQGHGHGGHAPASPAANTSDEAERLAVAMAFALHRRRGL